MSNIDWKAIGNAFAQIGRSVLSFFGLDSAADWLARETNKAKFQKAEDVYGKLNELSNKISNKYGLDLYDVQNKMASIAGIPRSYITNGAIRSERKSLKQKQNAITNKYNSDSGKLATAHEVYSKYASDNDVGKAIDSDDRLNKVDQMINAIEGGL